MPNLGKSQSTFWIKFTISNRSENEELLLHLENPILDIVELYSFLGEGKYKIEKTGDLKKYNERFFDHQNFIFALRIPAKKSFTYYLKIKSSGPILVPLTIGEAHEVFLSLLHTDMLYAVFFGLLIVMILYNLVLFITIKDNNYLLYVGYIFFIGMSQASLVGYPLKYLYPDFPLFFNRSIVAYLSIASIFATLFFKSFLLTEKYFSFFNKITPGIILCFLISLALSSVGFINIAFDFFDIYACIWPWLIFFASFKAAKKGYGPAKIVFAGWLIANVGFTIYAFRNLGVLTYNYFTNYTMVLGISMEAIIFSIALGDRINILKKENDIKQDEIIKHLKENEKYLKISQELAVNSERLKKEILSSNYESLKNQVNPHFLFNSLNVLTELVYRNQDEAAKFVKELSDIYRYVLENKSKEVVNIQAEFDFIRSFTYLLKIRYGENIIIHINYDIKTECMVAPLALQLLVENCIKHNVISKDEPLTIKIYTEGDYIVVLNNLQLKTDMPGSSRIGLKNIEERYRYLSDKPVIVSNDGHSFMVKIPKLITE